LYSGTYDYSPEIPSTAGISVITGKTSGKEYIKEVVLLDLYHVKYDNLSLCIRSQ
jgi:hypothetical protein